MDVRESFEVVRKPMVAVRSQPSTDGLIAAGLDFSVFSVEFGQHVDTFGADDSGQWRRVYCQCTKAAKQDVPLPRDPVQAWIMIQHPSLGQLLRHLE
ncbi:Putative glucuronoxylan glucuronosyltransferase IRX7 [Durusdinium trenchii]|uniref:Glucuronoxylan glucuronosyltransferase IRX7 n=1 Tax=Durusdinium trenchii TaxID=1381693 RepID=A0ABP0LDD0_9DINO